MAKIVGINKQGEEVALNKPGVAYQVDKDEAETAKFIEGIKAKAVREDGFSVISDVNKDGVSGVFHQSVEGIAVPLTAGDTKTPEQKLDELRKEGKIETDAVTGTSVVSESKAPRK